MAYIVIDLMGDDDVITVSSEKSKEELAREEAMRKHALEEIFRRAPQPTLEIVPVDNSTDRKRQQPVKRLP